MGYLSIISADLLFPAPNTPVGRVSKGMKLGTGWPIGPLALIDLIGIDVHVHVCEALWNAFREPRFAPPPRLVRMVQAGLLGRKSGRGFYRYDE